MANIVNVITPENINEVLNSVMKNLDEAYMQLGAPGCSSDKVGEIRCEALRSVQNAKYAVRNIIHNLYLLT